MWSTMKSSSKPLSYELLAEVGEGCYGKVYKAREVGERQRLLAVKKFNIRGEASQSGIPAFMIREVALLRKMEDFNHPNVVKLLDASAIPVGLGLDLTLVLEYIDQDLSTYLSKVPASGLSRDQDVMLQLLRGLDFLHTNLVLHRDLKPENILVSNRGEVKIADFGLARIHTFNMALTPGVVTLWYRAPEVLLNSVYMSSVDMWSVGCIFAELFLLRPLFQGCTEVQQLQKIFDGFLFSVHQGDRFAQRDRLACRHPDLILTQLGIQTLPHQAAAKPGTRRERPSVSATLTTFGATHGGAGSVERDCRAEEDTRRSVPEEHLAHRGADRFPAPDKWNLCASQEAFRSDGIRILPD
ncbi:cyclin-dependent kinase 4 isoform X2 [Amphiprion ocellaris]|uniref:cyclin-dependent kinase 4 isoform X2 n=1 Tax=Amphiprion ocellaris TaxID=80972 RepID=UPI0024117D80|nr:cyclin-dependent kinase 4 isoform X2 [Amphiprion ocellaris]